MTTASSPGPDDRPRERGDSSGPAEALFAEYVRAGAGEGAAFDDFVQRHPNQAEALRALHSLWVAGDLAGPEASPRSDPSPPTEQLEAAGALRGALKAFAEAAHPPAMPPPPEHIPDYRLVEAIGEGGFGAVYRAEQERPIRRTVAIKVIKLGMDTREAVARFEAERQALALMNHPSIARVYEAGATATGRPYFVMEYIQGEPITAYCERVSSNVDERLHLFLTVCEAVEHAHQKGVIHRDLKPSNVLVSLEGSRPVPKVIDFGIAKAIGRQLTEHTLRTEMGQIIGTPLYMSPEQADLAGTDIDTRSDIYSLGVLLYELLARAPPFDREALQRKSLDEVLRFVREEEPSRPSTRLERLASEGTEGGAAAARIRRADSRRLRGDLDWITLKAMAKDRGRRYGAVSELAADIRRHLRHEPVLAGPPSAAYRLRKLARKHRGLVSAAAVLLSTAAVAAAFFLVRAELAFRRDLERIRTAVEARNLAGARTSLAVVSERHYGRREVLDLERAVSALEADLSSEESASLLAAAREDWGRHLERRGEVRELQRAWEEKRVQVVTFAPPWERGEEFEIHDRLEAARREAQDLYDSAVAVFQRAIDAAPQGSEAKARARSAFALAYQEMQTFADREGAVAFGPDFFRQRGASLDAALFARRGGQLRVTTQPPGASVYCFRYEEHEKRLLPLPFDPRAGSARVEDGVLRGPSLRIESVLDEGRSPFRAGDRLLAVSGKPVAVAGDLARALAGVAAGASVEAVVERAGGRISISWVPFAREREERLDSDARLEPGRLISPREQLGLVLAGYPLECADGCLLGATREGTPLEASLPDGSYLLVLRRAGHVDARWPLRVASKDASIEVRLLPEAEAPPGFVYVPAGPFTRGGDPEAFQALPLEEVFVDGFLMGRFEVTFEEYIEFLNDPVAKINERGEAPPTQEEARTYVRALVLRGTRERATIDVLPRRDSGESLVRRDGAGRWALIGGSVRSARCPVFGVSRFAAEEYAHWLTLRRPGGVVARYRLPADDEWEKAARGADRRRFVWGDYPVWSFAWLYRGIHLRQKEAAEVGFCPADESVYGVRDLTGSVSEHAVGQPSRPYRYSSVRGGNWHNTDEYYGRAATRNGLLPLGSAQSTGFRLVGELRPPAPR